MSNVLERNKQECILGQRERVDVIKASFYGDAGSIVSGGGVPGAINGPFATTAVWPNLQATPSGSCLFASDCKKAQRGTIYCTVALKEADTNIGMKCAFCLVLKS